MIFQNILLNSTDIQGKLSAAQRLAKFRDSEKRAGYISPPKHTAVSERMVKVNQGVAAAQRQVIPKVTLDNPRDIYTLLYIYIY